MNNIAHLATSESIPDVIISDDAQSLIKEGVYDLRFLHYETALMFGRSRKVIFWFKIIENGPYFGMKFARYYNADRLIGKTGRNGKFAPKRRSDLVHEFLRVFPDYKPDRLDRLPLSKFKNVIVRGRIKTCTKDYKQRDTPELLQYSFISELKGAKRI